MIFSPKKDIAFVLPPRVATRSIRQWLRNHGWMKAKFSHHHSYEVDTIAQRHHLKKRPKVIMPVRNPYDRTVSLAHMFWHVEHVGFWGKGKERSLEYMIDRLIRNTEKAYPTFTPPQFMGPLSLYAERAKPDCLIKFEEMVENPIEVLTRTIQQYDPAFTAHDTPFPRAADQYKDSPLWTSKSHVLTESEIIKIHEYCGKDFELGGYEMKETESHADFTE